MDAEYKDSKFTGRKYIKKIIQVPIILPEWKKTDVYEIIDNLVRSGRLSSDYSHLIDENKSVLATVIEPNPRKIKRFINNFIISNELFSQQLGKNISKEALIIIQAIRFRWNNFYKQFSSDKKLRDMLELFLDNRIPFEDFIGLMKGEDSINEGSIRMIKAEQALRSRPIDDVDDLLLSLKKNYFSKLQELDKDLWEFLLEQRDKIYSIRNWEDYRATAEFSKEVPIPKKYAEKDVSDGKEVP